CLGNILHQQGVAATEIEQHVASLVGRQLTGLVRAREVEVREVEQVGTVLEVADRIVTVTHVEGEDVRSPVAEQRVVALAADESIVAGPASERVRTHSAEQDVVAAAADQRIPSRITGNRVVAGTAGEGVAAAAAAKRIVSATTDDVVGPSGALEDVAAAGTGNRLVALAADDVLDRLDDFGPGGDTVDDGPCREIDGRTAVQGDFVEGDGVGPGAAPVAVVGNAGVGDHDEVVARAAREGIGAGALDQPVVAVAAAQGVVAVAAIERVVAVASGQRVSLVAAVYAVVAAGALEYIAAATPLQGVIATAGIA